MSTQKQKSESMAALRKRIESRIHQRDKLNQEIREATLDLRTRCTHKHAKVKQEPSCWYDNCPYTPSYIKNNGVIQCGACGSDWIGKWEAREGKFVVVWDTGTPKHIVETVKARRSRESYDSMFGPYLTPMEIKN